MPETLIESLARFATELRIEQVPGDVLELTKLQLRAVLASLYSGAASEAGQQAIRAARTLASSGRSSLLPTGEKTSAFCAVLANGAASMAYDFDDYLFLGHTGHSAVLASLAVAEEVDASLEDLLLAQVAANEVAGRLGGYVAVGPQNGQLWAHIHLAGAAVAASRLRGLDQERCADAIAIAFYQPPFSLWPGFMGSEAKVLTAAWPSAQGIFAASLAAEGMLGARSLLEHPHGFATRFSFLPLPELVGALGERWVSRSLSFKAYPGCAYIDGPVDAALAARPRELRVDDISHIDIEASALTVGMEALCERANTSAKTDLAPITINFSARRSVAIALLAGELTPRQLDHAWLETNRAAITRLVQRVRLTESRPLTVSVLAGLAEGFPLAELTRAVGAPRAGRALSRMLRTFEGSLGSGERRTLPSLTDLRSVAAALPILREAGPFDLHDADFGALEFRFGARVRLELNSGEHRTGEALIPRGAAGSPDRAEVVLEKLRAEALAHDAPGAAGALEALLDRDPATIRAADLARTMAAPAR